MEATMYSVHPPLDARTRAVALTLSPGLVRLVVLLLSVGVLLAWQLAAAAPAYAKAGDLDRTFGVGGKVTTDFSGFEDNANGVVIQPDGKLVAAGAAGPGTSRDFALARYFPDGTLDPSFGTGGKVTTDFFGFTDSAQALVRQPDGKLVAAGAAFTFTTFNFEFALARYNSDGTLDPGFGTGGMVTTDLTGGEDVAFALVLQPDGKLVAAGGRAGDFALARYNPDGTLDPGFGSGGVVMTDFAGGIDEVQGLTIQPDGKLVTAGVAATAAGDDFALARYLPDGSLDASFGTGGKVTTDFTGNLDTAFVVTVQPDGRLVAAGEAGTVAAPDFGLARYQPDGTLDASFGTGGKVTTDFAGGDDKVFALAVRPRGKLVAAGRAFTGASEDYALARYERNGALDRSFGRRGTVTTDFNGDFDQALDLAVQADGKLVAAGQVGSVTVEDFGLARYRA
jgi:uncharacterized delta-60 repeat protein